jgi:hypothetical protein
LPRQRLGDFGAIASFLHPDGIIVFTPKMAHVVAVDGAVVRSTSYSAAEFPKVELTRVTSGGAIYGGLVEVFPKPGTYEERFCVFDGDGRYDGDRCAVLANGPILAAVAHDGERFHVYHVRERDAVMHRWIVDSSGSLLETADVWAFEGLGNVLAARATQDRALVFTVGWDDDCSRILAHMEDDRGQTTSNLLVGEDVANKTVLFGVDASLPVLVFAGCSWAGQVGCERADETVTFLSTYHGAQMTQSPTKVPIPYLNAGAALFFDGTSTVVAYHRDLHDLSLSRFAVDGEVELSELRIPLAYDAPGAELHNVHAGLALGPNDYVVVYDMSGSRGEETRIARFRVE